MTYRDRQADCGLLADNRFQFSDANRHQFRVDRRPLRVRRSIVLTGRSRYHSDARERNSPITVWKTVLVSVNRDSALA